MDFVKDVLPLLGSMVAVVVILYLTYIASKTVSKKYSQISNGGSIKIVERIGLAQDKMLVIAQVEEEYLLLGVSNNNISILKELPEYSPKEEPSRDFFKKVGKTK